MPIIKRTMSNIYGLEDALDDITDRITEVEQTIFKQDTAPTTAEGADEGDVWYDTLSETFNVYREYPAGSGVFIWEPVIYHNNDIVDGGTW